MSAARIVLLDTNAFSALFVTPEHKARKQGHPTERWREAILGHRVVIAFQTRAEVLVGAGIAMWGAPRTKALVELLDSTPTVPLDQDVLEAYVELSVESRRQGKGISQSQHTADRWIAACAIAKNVPLLTNDRIFIDAPGLTLVRVDQ